MATIATLIAGLASAGATAYSASQAGKGMGGVPKAAPYKPIDFTKEQKEAIKANLSSLPEINQLVTGANNIITTDALNRAKRLIPGYTTAMEIEGRNVNNLLQGRLPYDDVLDIVSDASGSNGAVGVPGTGSPATLRDLGLSKLQAIQSGSGLLKDMVNIAETISPRGSYVNPQSMFVTPVQRIQAQLGQRPLEQQSAQSANNLAVAANPAQMAQASANTGYADAAASLLSSLGGLYGKGYFSGMPSGTYMGKFPTNPDPNVRNRVYRGTAIPV